MRARDILFRRFAVAAGAIILLASTGLVFAQEDVDDEWEEWQKASREEQREHQEYLKNPKKSNYLDWRSAQRDANREHEEYKLAIEMRAGYPYPIRRNVIVVGQARPERTVVVAGNGNGKYVKATKVVYVDGTNGRYINGNVKRISGNGNAVCGTGTAYLNGKGYAYAAYTGNGEFDDWAAAEREVAREHEEFLSNPSDDNFAGWKEAQADACREYAEYRTSTPVAYATSNGSVLYTEAALPAASLVRTSYVRRRAAVRRAKARKAKRCYCR